MKRVGAMLAMGFACAAFVAAQTSTAQSQPSSQRSAAQPNATITVVGCLQRGDASSTPGGTTSTSGTTASRTQSGSGAAASFILTNAMPASGSTTGGTTAGTTGSTTGTAGGATPRGTTAGGTMPSGSASA